MNLLLVLWWSSLLLAGIALAWMAGLIVARLLRENRETRRKADRQTLSSFYLAIMAGTDDAAEKLRPFQHRSRLLAETLLEVLGLVRGVERDRLVATLVQAGVDERLRFRLTRGSRAGRLAAVEALSAFPSDATRAELRSVQQASSDAEIRIATVRTLIDIGDPPRVQDLIADLAGWSDKDSLLYAPILRHLAIHAPDDALAALVIPELKVAARAVMIDAVGASGDYRALPTLSLLAADPEPVLRMAAVRAMGLLAHPGAADTITCTLRDDAWDVRAEAATAAGKIGTASLTLPLVALLDDPVWWVRFRAADALARMGNGGVEALRIATTSPIDVTRRSAALALAERGIA